MIAIALAINFDPRGSFDADVRGSRDLKRQQQVEAFHLITTGANPR